MKVKDLKNKVKLAAWQMLPSSQSTCAMLSTENFDWLVIDLEHTTISLQDAQIAFSIAKAHQVQSFARLSSSDFYQARRILDAGAQGLIIPVVEEVEAYNNFAKHCFFPPEGCRGTGLVQSNLWGDDLDQYFKEFRPIMIAQIETKKAIKNIGSILDCKWIDGIMIGPYDLSADYGYPGDFERREFKDSIERVIKAVKTKNKFIGYHQVKPILKELENCIQKGYDFVAYGTDITAIRSSLKINITS